MFPEPFGYPAFSLVLPATVAVGFVVTGVSARRLGLPVGKTLLFLFALTVAGLVGAKAFSLWERPALPTWRAELLFGYRHPGAIVLMTVASPLLWIVLMRGKGRFLSTLDAIATSAPFSLAVLRVSCFLQGCCVGAVCSQPWCVSFPRHSQAWHLQHGSGLIQGGASAALPVHPLHLYLMAASLGIGMAMLWYGPRRRYDGELALLFLLLHEGAKALLETLRVPHHLSLQLTSASIAGAAGVCLLLLFFRSRRPAITG